MSEFPPELLEALKNLPDFGLPDFETILGPTRHEALLPNRDFIAAALALEAQVELTFGAIAAQEARIREVEERAAETDGETNEWAVADHASECHHGVFLEAAATHSCVAGFAQFYEGMFNTVFSTLRQRLPEDKAKKLTKRAKDEGFADWVYRLLGEVGGADLFTDVRKHIVATYAFRNAALHNGYEWPVEEREKFHQKVAKLGCQDCFEWSYEGAEPWIAYPKREFLSAFGPTARQALKAIGDLSLRLSIRG